MFGFQKFCSIVQKKEGRPSRHQVLKASNRPLSYKRDKWYLLVGDKLNTRTLLLVLDCLKDHAFHTETVYVNSLDPQ